MEWFSQEILQMATVLDAIPTIWAGKTARIEITALVKNSPTSEQTWPSFPRSVDYPPSFRRLFFIPLIIFELKHRQDFSNLTQSSYSVYPRCFPSSSTLTVKHVHLFLISKGTSERRKSLSKIHGSLEVLDFNNAMNKKGYSAILSEQGMHSQH